MPAGLDLKKLHDFKSDFHPLTRSIADIKATARKVVVPPPPPRPSPSSHLLPLDLLLRLLHPSPHPPWSVRWNGLLPSRPP